MTPNLIPLYGCAVLTIAALGLFARQNHRSGWKRHRSENLAEALDAFYGSLGVHASVDAPVAPAALKPLTVEESLGFSAQMLKLQSALGESTEVTENAPALVAEPVSR